MRQVSCKARHYVCENRDGKDWGSQRRIRRQVLLLHVRDLERRARTQAAYPALSRLLQSQCLDRPYYSPSRRYGETREERFDLINTWALSAPSLHNRSFEPYQNSNYLRMWQQRSVGSRLVHWHWQAEVRTSRRFRRQAGARWIVYGSPPASMPQIGSSADASFLHAAPNASDYGFQISI